jgi:ABC-type dipeptide/oligopeptide/nickel transport system permease component
MAGCREIFDLWRKAATEKGKERDVHTRIMKRNYKSVPQWWFHLMLVLVLALSLFTCEGFGGQLQLPYWGLLLACAIALTFTLPIGIITATTNMVLSPTRILITSKYILMCVYLFQRYVIWMGGSNNF